MFAIGLQLFVPKKLLHLKIRKFDTESVTEKRSCQAVNPSAPRSL